MPYRTIRTKAPLSERAAGVNNGGVDAQVAFLRVEGWTDERIVEAAGKEEGRR